MDTTNKLPLDMLYHWESAKANSLYMTQPIGDGKVEEYTWGRAVGEARCIASYLKSLDLPEKSRIGLISKNCAQWIMADWAIWMAGYVSVPLYPTLNADTVNYVLNHAECDVLFVGKLDDWDNCLYLGQYRQAERRHAEFPQHGIRCSGGHGRSAGRPQ